MKRSIEVIREEHVWIGDLLVCLERVTEEAERTGQLEPRNAASVLALCEYFADDLHQRKEEVCLYPALLMKASNAEARDIAAMMAEHEAERRMMKGLADNLLGGVAGEPLSLRAFVRTSGEYVRHHRAHIAHEALQLLPLAERLLDDEEDRKVLEGFERLAEESLPHTPIGERIRELCVRLDVAPGGSGSSRAS
jgi:hemerythrin-like domain-containing protein